MKLSAACCLMSLSLACAQAAPPAASVFFATPALSAPRLSPDGTMLAMLSKVPGKTRSIVIVDLASMKARPLVRYNVGDVADMGWVGDKRLVYTVENIPESVMQATSGLYAVDADGSNSVGLSPAMVGQRSFMGKRAANDNYQNASFFGVFPSRSDLFSVGVSYNNLVSLGSLNTRTKRLEDVESPPGSSFWLLDENDQPRVAQVSETDGAQTIHVRRDRRWQELASAAMTAPDYMAPLLYTRDAFYVRAYAGADLASLYRYDLVKGALEPKPLLTSPNFDLDGYAITDERKMIGFRMALEAYETIWFDETLKAAQKDIDDKLPGTINNLFPPKRGNAPFIAVYAASPVEPGRIFVYNRETKVLHQVGRALPEIDTDSLPNSVLDYYTTREGKKMPVLVTMPKGSSGKKLPLVVLLSPLPWQRNAFYDWDAEVQFLVSRGYAVIEPEARGTHGFGRANLVAGKRQWGLAMQDDIVDSARWAIASGLADGSRICVAGSGYGGYAAMMGVLREPALFRCAVSMGGIVDIGMMFERNWKGFSLPHPTYMKETVGDPVRDKAQFDATSPLKQAARIRNPVLLAYAEADPMVPGQHGKLLFEAIKAGSAQSELHLYQVPGTSMPAEQNLPDMWSRIDAFLSRHIGSR